MALKYRTGLTEDSFKHLLIGPGAIMADFDLDEFDPDDESTWGIPLGATKGGNKFFYDTEYHVAEPDGTLGAIKGMEWLIAANGRIETQLMEMSKRTMNNSMANFNLKTYNARYDLFEHNGEIAPTQYRTIALVAELIGSRDPIIIILENARVTTGVEVDLNNGKDDVVIPTTFEARYDPGAPTKVPVKILYPKLSGGFLTAPEANPAGGDFSNDVSVELTAESGATIYYTTDGSLPTALTGTEYTGAITITTTTTVKAIAVKGSDVSPVSTNIYTIT
ncbi:chitobiase/beta-hexosaminidase C-terminal domain-containing protein [Sporosarcina soli]|uniref:Chitobiase/beta-hexosaminidase C-terminal domain-containing protein n=1 Tax=Sporosarcina soli TaxID=334736 RepID=A0ABW0TE29_9BACL